MTRSFDNQQYKHILDITDGPNAASLQASWLLSDQTACRKAFSDYANSDARESELAQKATEARRSGDYRQAERILVDLLQLQKGHHGQNSPEVAHTLGLLGKVCALDKRFEAASNYFKQAVNVDKVVFGANHTITAQDLHCLSCAEGKNGSSRNAIQHFEEAIAIYQKHEPFRNKEVGWMLAKTIADYINFALYDEGLEQRTKAFKELFTLADHWGYDVLVTNRTVEKLARHTVDGNGSTRTIVYHEWDWIMESG